MTHDAIIAAVVAIAGLALVIGMNVWAERRGL